MSFNPLAGLLGGGGGGAPGGEPGMAGSGGPPPSIQVGGGGSDGPDNAKAQAALQAAASAMQDFVANEGDPADKSIGSQILAKIHSIEAGRAKERDAAMGMSPALKMVQRHTQGNSPQGASQGGGY